MADKSKMTAQEVLAACRQQDGSGGGATEPKSETPVQEPVSESKPSPAPTTPTAGAAKPGAMSVAEMLAAARSEKSGGAAKSEPPAASTPADKPAVAKPAGKMSVADMLAAARGEKAGGAAKPAEKKAPAAAKPAAEKKEAAQPAPVAAAKPAAAPAKSGGPKDTASILSAARGTAKPGPMTKAEAAAKADKSVPKPVAKAAAVPPMPAKPEYAKAPRPAAPPSERRGFLAAFLAIFAGALFMTSSLAIGFSSLAVTSLLWTLGLARFMFPNILTEPPTRFKVGFPDEYGPGQVETKYIAQFGVWIVRYEYEGQPQIYAIQSVCTHLGCTPNWLEGEQKFKCPCHGSGFYKDGINFEGPAPRPLERFAIRIADDGQLEVDKSQKFKEEVGQWKNPASFVAV